MSEEEIIKNIKEIVELSKEEIESNNKNITAILDLEDLKSLQGLLDLYNKEKQERIKFQDMSVELATNLDALETDYQQEKEKNKELIDGQISTLKKILLPELLKKFISKDKIRELLKQYAYTEIGDTDKIIEFYKKTQELLEE